MDEWVDGWMDEWMEQIDGWIVVVVVKEVVVSRSCSCSSSINFS